MKRYLLTGLIILGLCFAPLTAVTMDRALHNPKFQAFDGNGDPLASGKVYTYETGTVTNKTTYSDRALSTPNANPVVLDSRGEASIYCSGLIKVVLKTSEDVIVWTMDSMRCTDSTSLADDDADTLIQVEESADEDKIRFDTGGTQRAIIDSNGLALAAGADVNEFSTDDTLAGDSDDAVPTEQAVKAYVDGAGYLVGDGTQSKIKVLLVDITDASTASEIDVAVTSKLNGDTGTADELGKGETQSNIYLHSDGTYIQLSQAFFTDNIEAVLTVNVVMNKSQTDVIIWPSITSGNLQLYPYLAPDDNSGTGTAGGGTKDITALVDEDSGAGRLEIWVTYLTAG